MKLETIKKLVLNNSGKPIGERNITITRDIMCYVEKGYLFLVKPVDNRPFVFKKLPLETEDKIKGEVMNPKNAIVILSEHVKISKLDYLPDVRDATKLGIEALKRELEKRQTMSLNEGDFLPGETED
ncbi:hypothetical protein ES703_66533 [subsurface metagenome]